MADFWFTALKRLHPEWKRSSSYFARNSIGLESRCVSGQADIALILPPRETDRGLPGDGGQAAGPAEQPPLAKRDAKLAHEGGIGLGLDHLGNRFRTSRNRQVPHGPDEGPPLAAVRRRLHIG